MWTVRRRAGVVFGLDEEGQGLFCATESVLNDASAVEVSRQAGEVVGGPADCLFAAEKGDGPLEVVELPKQRPLVPKAGRQGRGVIRAERLLPAQRVERLRRPALIAAKTGEEPKHLPEPGLVTRGGGEPLDHRDRLAGRTLFGQQDHRGPDDYRVRPGVVEDARYADSIRKGDRASTCAQSLRTWRR